jgi:hypothetical protein
MKKMLEHANTEEKSLTTKTLKFVYKSPVPFCHLHSTPLASHCFPYIPRSRYDALQPRFIKQELKYHLVATKEGIFLFIYSVKAYVLLAEYDVNAAIEFKGRKESMLHSLILLQL